MVKVLVVEDNEINQDLIKRRLIRKKFEVFIASDGLEALEMVGECKPAIILLDLSLPKLDGWGVAKSIKTNSAISDIPIIALTAHAMEGDREKALEAGCDDFEVKPINYDSLFGKINKFLNLGAVD